MYNHHPLRVVANGLLKPSTHSLRQTTKMGRLRLFDKGISCSVYHAWDTCAKCAPERLSIHISILNIEATARTLTSWFVVAVMSINLKYI